PAALPPKDFFLSAGQSKAEAFAEIDSATQRGVGLILAGFLAAIYAAWAGGRKFVRRPIEGLLKVTAEWRRGNYEARARLEDRSRKGLARAQSGRLADPCGRGNRIFQQFSLLQGSGVWLFHPGRFADCRPRPFRTPAPEPDEPDR